MPTPTTGSTHQPTDLLDRLGSPEPEIKLKALRELKNQIIGNRTKKLFFLKLGAVPAVASVLRAGAEAEAEADDVSKTKSNIIVQSAAVLGSFACGFEAGVRAVLDSGSFPLLFRLLSYPDEKVVDAGARSLRMIYQSKLAPKYEFLEGKSMEFLISLLNSESDNVTSLGASIITHSTNTGMEQMALSDAGVVKKLIRLLDGSLTQRDASLEALGIAFRNNPEVVSNFVGLESGKALSCISELINDRYPRTRLLACTCLIAIRNTCPCYLQDMGVKKKLVHLLLDLLDDSGQVEDEAPLVFSSLIAEKEDMQKLAFDVNAVDKLCHHLQISPLRPKRFEAILLVLGELCSKLETCRLRFIHLQALNCVVDALTHDSADVRVAACIFLRSITRSIKNLCAGIFMKDTLIVPLLQLLDDASSSVQVAALGAISNMVVDFATGKSLFVQSGGLRQLVRLIQSMDAAIRSKALLGLRNMMFLADYKCKEVIFLEIAASLLSSLICDPEPFVQEQALALVRNLVDGSINSIEYTFRDDGILIDTIGRKLQTANVESAVQGLYVLVNIASGNEFHKEAVMRQLISQVDDGKQPFMIKFLQSNNSCLRTAAIWVIVNLTIPSCPGASARLGRLRAVGIISTIRNMVNDPCLDVKLRVRTVLTQSMTLGDSPA